MFLIGSPMCKAFSSLQHLAKGGLARDTYKELLRKSMIHMEFVASLYRLQHAAGRKFLHEHPWGASSWALECIQSVLELEGVSIYRCDQCAFGATTTTSPYDSLPAGLIKKATGWMTNSSIIGRAVAKRCSNTFLPPSRHHRHTMLIGGRASAAERYPERLVKCILRALREELLPASGPCLPSAARERSVPGSVGAGAGDHALHLRHHACWQHWRW